MSSFARDSKPCDQTQNATRVFYLFVNSRWPTRRVSSWTRPHSSRISCYRFATTTRKFATKQSNCFVCRSAFAWAEKPTSSRPLWWMRTLRTLWLASWIVRAALLSTTCIEYVAPRLVLVLAHFAKTQLCWTQMVCSVFHFFNVEFLRKIVRVI